jgi:hypothetical protein
MSLADKHIQSTTHPFLRAEIHYDPEPQNPYPRGAESSFHITYNPRSRHTLGNETADADEDARIATMVRDGKAVGMPVWAYVHGSSTLCAAYQNPFGCPWDSGRSGWVYATNEELRKFFNVKRLTKKYKETALAYMQSDVQTFSAYLNGECYGFVIRDTRNDEALDSCWGYYGLDDVRKNAESALRQMESITPYQRELELTVDQGD